MKETRGVDVVDAMLKECLHRVNHDSILYIISSIRSAILVVWLLSVTSSINSICHVILSCRY